MDNFSLLKSLSINTDEDEHTKRLNETKQLVATIDYAEYDVALYNNRNQKVYIPRRETELFEHDLVNTSLLTDSVLKSIIRKYNGVTEIK